MAARTLICLTFVAAFAESSLGQIEPVDLFDDPAETAIERLVAQERDMLFNNATLRNVAEFLDFNGIPTQIDVRALADVGLTPDEPVTFQQRAVRLSDGLHLLLRQLDLTWTIRDRHLVITTPEESENQLITKIYDVRNLVEPPVLMVDASGYYSMMPSVVWTCDFDTLIELITSSIAPDSWDELGGAGSIECYVTRRMRVLVISQTYEVQQQVDALLRQLAKFGGRDPLPPVPAHSLPVLTQAPAAIPMFPASMGISNTGGIRSSQLRMTGR